MDKNNAQAVTIGVDISKRKLDLALLREGRLKHKSFPNTVPGFSALTGWLQQQQVATAHVCLESTNVYGEALAEYLHDRGFIVSIVNPARIKGFALSELSRTKTDKADAGVIARFCAALQPAPWSPDPLEIRELRALVRRLEALIEMRTQEVNRLQVAPPVVAKALSEHIAYLDSSIKTIKQRIRDHIDDHPDLKQKRSCCNRSLASVRRRSAWCCRNSPRSTDSRTPSAWPRLSGSRRVNVSRAPPCGGVR